MTQCTLTHDVLLNEQFNRGFRFHVLYIKPCIRNACSDIQHHKVHERKSRTAAVRVKERKVWPPAKKWVLNQFLHFPSVPKEVSILKINFKKFF